MINKSLNYMYKTVSSYCANCQKSTENKYPNVVKTKNGRKMLLSKCVVYNSTKSKFMKEQQTRGSLSNLTGIKILILSDLSIINTLF